MKNNRAEVLPTGEIMFNGVKYPGYRSLIGEKFNPDKWFKFWDTLIEEIKFSKLTFSDISNLYDEFRTHIFMYGAIKKMRSRTQEVMQLMTHLNFALIKAYNNYLDSKGKFWAFLFGYSAEKIINKMNPKELSKIIGNQNR